MNKSFTLCVDKIIPIARIREERILVLYKVRPGHDEKMLGRGV